MSIAPAEGRMSGRDLDVLRELSRGKTVLEIGTWRGRSALEMAYEAAEVWCVDTFCGDKYTATLYGEQFTLPDFAKNARERGLWDKMRILVGRWEDVLPRLDLTGFGLVFYDASHDYEETLAAGQQILSHVPLECTVAFHDYSSNFPQVIRAVDQLAREHCGRPLQRHGDILAVLGPRQPPPPISGSAAWEAIDGTWIYRGITTEATP